VCTVRWAVSTPPTEVPFGDHDWRDLSQARARCLDAGTESTKSNTVQHPSQVSPRAVAARQRIVKRQQHQPGGVSGTTARLATDASSNPSNLPDKRSWSISAETVLYRTCCTYCAMQWAKRVISRPRLRG